MRAESEIEQQAEPVIRVCVSDAEVDPQWLKNYREVSGMRRPVHILVLPPTRNFAYWVAREVPGKVVHYFRDGGEVFDGLEELPWEH